MIQRNLKGEEIIPNENKYRQFIYNNLDEISMIDTTYMKYKDRMKYIDNICNLVDFARFYLVNSEKEIEKLVDRYDIDIIADEVEATIKVLEWGKTSINEIDFTDMIWLPYVLDLKPIGLLFDYILGDECQDFSIAQREGLSTENWTDPEKDIRNLKAKERYGIGILNNGRAITVAKNIAVAASYPAAPTVVVNTK